MVMSELEIVSLLAAWMSLSVKVDDEKTIKI